MLDDERKAAMVSNLLVVLCGSHDTQPVVNTGQHILMPGRDDAGGEGGGPPGAA